MYLLLPYLLSQKGYQSTVCTRNVRVDMVVYRVQQIDCTEILTRFSGNNTLNLKVQSRMQQKHGV